MEYMPYTKKFVKINISKKTEKELFKIKKQLDALSLEAVIRALITKWNGLKYNWVDQALHNNYLLHIN